MKRRPVHPSFLPFIAEIYILQRLHWGLFNPQMTECFEIRDVNLKLVALSCLLKATSLFNSSKTKFMKKKNNAYRRSRIAGLSLFLLFFTVTVFNACKEGDENGGGTKEFTLSCVTLSKAQVQAWVDSGWTRDSQTSIRQLLLQPYSGNVADINSNMTLVAYPGITWESVKLGGKSILVADTSCKALTVTGPVIFSDNTIRLSTLKIFNPDGTLNKFDFIRFIPRRYSMNQEYISYAVEVVRDGKVDEEKNDGTHPCPPYCCPPYCD